MKLLTWWIGLAMLCLQCSAQDSLMLAQKLTSRYADKVEEKMNGIEEGLTKQSQKALNRLQKQQQKVYKALHPLDSNAAKAFLQQSQQQYTATLTKLKDKTTGKLTAARTYIPGLDSAGSVLKYLGKLPEAGSLPGKEKLTNALTATAGAGLMLDKATEVKKLMQQQQQQLKALASRYKELPIAKQLKAYNKEIYYYSQRVQQAKETLNDPDKVEKAVLTLLRKNEGFKSWMGQNGQLAQLFGGVGSSVGNPAQAIAGLQTRQSVQALVQSRLGGSLQQAQQAMTGAVQQAQGQMNSMRSRLQQLGAGSFSNGGNATMPDFKPNNQKTKSFLNRLEYGFNLQSKGRSRWQPSTTDIGLSLGYKLNDKSTVGIGVAYKLGWGAPIKNIQFSHQGIGLRTYMDYKLKGSFWLNVGYEQNYNNSFKSFDVLQAYSAWQYSGLIGLNKKSKQGKRTIETKLLWDFLSYQLIPRSQPILFRIEYKLK